ncbi:MAG: sulfatase-like hydrolase/transferase, partial [Planctomycetota bacterium]|nr:sulfatase-like hydrolase/transferase [Planctomycetota bacterium]
MSSSITRAERVRSAFWGAATVVVLAALAWSGWKAWSEASTQDWSEPGRSWLGFDFWTSSFLATLVLWKALIPSALLGGVVGWFGCCPLRLCGRPGAFTAALGLGVVLVGSTVFTRATPPADAPNVLIVMVDTVRADHVSFYGYERETWPALGRLAKDGVVFENAITQAPWTKPT